MDQGLEATAIKVIATMAVIVYAGTTVAQPPQSGAQPTAPTAAEPQVGTSIFGSTALPQGLTIVPWQGADSGQITSSPIRQVEEPLEPIDPAEFRRRLQYHQQSDAE